MDFTSTSAVSVSDIKRHKHSKNIQTFSTVNEMWKNHSHAVTCFDQTYRVVKLVSLIFNYLHPKHSFTSNLFSTISFFCGCSSSKRASLGLHWHALACSFWCVHLCVHDRKRKIERQSRRRGCKHSILWLSHMGIHERQAGRRIETSEGWLSFQL